eukprot:6210738-Pleurochrysis_carterae.AAC.2
MRCTLHAFGRIHREIGGECDCSRDGMGADVGASEAMSMRVRRYMCVPSSVCCSATCAGQCACASA